MSLQRKVDSLLSRLEGVKSTGQNRWIAKCPAHDDRNPSLAITEHDDDHILIHDFAGCETEAVLSAVGLTFADLFPDRMNSHEYKPKHPPFNAQDVLRCVSFEALVVSIAAANIAKQNILSEQDCNRLLLASERLQSAAEVFGYV